MTLTMRSPCIPTMAIDRQVPARTRHYAESIDSRLRVLTIATWISAFVTCTFGIWQLFQGGRLVQLALANLACSVIFLLIPVLYRFGAVVAPLAFCLFAFLSVSFMCFTVGTGSGLQFYFLVAASLLVLVLGIERIVLASALVAIGVVAMITLELVTPVDRGLGQPWTLTVGFISSAVSAALMIVATVWYALREIGRAEQAMEAEYARSEALLANILPSTIASRLKDPSRTIIADKYDDASVLFADIAGYTERASDTAPSDLVQFLDGLYTDLDALVDRHGLEKIKTSGDSYMVVSGVPEPRPDHVEALACLALDIAEAVAGLTDLQGRAVPLRIGLATGPVVAGVVGARKFFYDVWGDAVNIASRMETTDVAGRIQVPQNVYDRIKNSYVLEERGDVDIKGKGVMHTWYLVGRREEAMTV